MNAKDIQHFRRVLLRQRQMLFREVSNTEADLQRITEDRESEFEELASDERTSRLLAQLDERGKVELDEIDHALARIDQQRYGRCEGCGGRIPLRRLAAVPATPYCRDCAQRAELGEISEGESPRSGPVPPDYSLLTDRELEEAVRDLLREDGRVDMDELRVVCRHGVTHLSGSIPSEAERQILLHTITDVLGLSEVVDRLQVKEILWEREDRDKQAQVSESKPWEEPSGTEDIIETHEQGVDFVPPTRPVPEEE